MVRRIAEEPDRATCSNGGAWQNGGARHASTKARGRNRVFIESCQAPYDECVAKVVLLNVVGLTPALLEHAPRLRALGPPAPLTPPLPAVTCTSQATMLTGLPPRGHGIVGNGWYFRELNEILFWRQSNRLVKGTKVWEEFRGTTANLFWWFNMATTAAISVTPRPAYFADGRKRPDVYSDPPGLGRDLQRRHGPFPLFRFWGPLAGIESTRWIASAAIDVIRERDPDLTLVYLPHLDYDLQRRGPTAPPSRCARSTPRPRASSTRRRGTGRSSSRSTGSRR
jgi:predicted AlkP superfamily pyrophosphatase or phosphodiesterase